MKPFRTRVCVLSHDSGERLHDVSPDEARVLCDSAMALVIDEPERYFIAAIQLTRSDDEIKAILHGHDKPKGRPKPILNPESSTGDAGRGLAPLIGNHRRLWYAPGPRA